MDRPPKQPGDPIKLSGGKGKGSIMAMVGPATLRAVIANRVATLYSKDGKLLGMLPAKRMPWTARSGDWLDVAGNGHLSVNPYWQYTKRQQLKAKHDIAQSRINQEYGFVDPSSPNNYGTDTGQNNRPAIVQVAKCGYAIRPGDYYDPCPQLGAPFEPEPDMPYYGAFKDASEPEPVLEIEVLSCSGSSSDDDEPYYSDEFESQDLEEDPGDRILVPESEADLPYYGYVDGAPVYGDPYYDEGPEPVFSGDDEGYTEYGYIKDGVEYPEGEYSDQDYIYTFRKGVLTKKTALLRADDPIVAPQKSSKAHAALHSFLVANGPGTIRSVEDDTVLIEAGGRTFKMPADFLSPDDHIGQKMKAIEVKGSKATEIIEEGPGPSVIKKCSWVTFDDPHTGERRRQCLGVGPAVNPNNPRIAPTRASLEAYRRDLRDRQRRGAFGINGDPPSTLAYNYKTHSYSRLRLPIGTSRLKVVTAHGNFSQVEDTKTKVLYSVPSNVLPRNTVLGDILNVPKSGMLEFNPSATSARNRGTSRQIPRKSPGQTI